VIKMLQYYFYLQSLGINRSKYHASKKISLVPSGNVEECNKPGNRKIKNKKHSKFY
jgi:hypothetical protein